MHRTVNTILLLSVLVLTTGCAALVVGAGTGAGVYTWVKGELIRSYASDLKRTENAVLQSLEYLKIPVEEKTQTASETTIKARQNDGSPVKVRITTVQYDMTEVAIRCGYVGYWDRKDAELIHATILGNL
ncbi:DUF3568 family protein [Desulfosarcina ovata]|uniref:Lipoprotein n=2 Tax=Desulfosarcina ovata TaxID=83564 RepID=A0A5K8AIL9_9BACT|nr:DUF3568 family protein [Desulfosarcina ovata]BBO85497.1 hypothetical protein DSCO28_60630 [Desulfosarcina ovata subsp. sediminis]BBO92532.1 hypothetical protein DSCOOX_57120 [Desulfosarcina ovata subsp. ovata]